MPDASDVMPGIGLVHDFETRLGCAAALLTMTEVARGI